MAQRYRFVIDGEDRSLYVQPGVSFELSIAGAGSASLRTIDQAGSWAPSPDETIEIYDDSVSPSLKLFGGLISQASQRHILGTSALAADVRCVDYSAFADRRVVGRYFNLLYGGTSANIANRLATDYLSDFGISYDSVNSMGSVVVGEATFNFVPVKEALDTLARLADCQWMIDSSKKLRLFRPDDGYYAAPADLTDGNENYVSARVTPARSRFANRIIVKTNRDLGALYTDTHYGDGVLTQFPTLYALTSEPVVKVNGVTQVVIESARLTESPIPAYDWYWISGGVGVFQNLSDPPLTGGGSPDQLQIIYPSKLPYVSVAEDTTSIAAVGLYEKVIEVKDVDSKDALDDVAAAELAARCQSDTNLEIVTRVDGFAPGQLVTVDLDIPAVSGDFLIESVSAREIDVRFFEYTLRMSQTMRREADPARFVQSLIAATRLPTPTPVETIRFTLAGTVEGLTNPGLTIGVKTALQVVQVGGIVKEVNLHWGSVAGGTSTSGDIEIEIYADGVSIFSGTGIVYSAGASGVVTRWNNFSSSPLKLAKGTALTLEVMQADASAKDGSLEIVIV